MTIDFAALGLAVTIPAFTGGAILVWFSGVTISHAADVIAQRSGLGHAFTGVLLLGVATSLPEIATTATATLGDHPVLAANNLLGGVAMQVAVLALVDAFGARGKPLTWFSASPVFLVQGVMLLVMLGIVCGAIASGEIFSIAGIGFWSLLLGATYLVALHLMYRYEQSPRWQLGQDQAEPQRVEVASRYHSLATRAVVMRFLAGAIGVLLGGYVVAETGAALATQTGVGESFIGATLVSIATSLPEVSSTFAAVRLGAFSMAAGNILGTNILEVALFLPADALYRGGPIFAVVEPHANLLTALGMIVTCIYLWGVLERKDRTVLGMGIDSVLVAIVYVGGMALYYRLVT